MGRVFGCLHVLTQIHTHTQASDLDLDTQTPVQKKKKKTHNKRQLDLPALLFIYTFICTFFLNIFLWCFCSFCFCCCCCCCCWLFTSVEHFLRLVVVVITVVRLCFFFSFSFTFSLEHCLPAEFTSYFYWLWTTNISHSLNLLLLSYVIFVDVVVLAVVHWQQLCNDQVALPEYLPWALHALCVCVLCSQGDPKLSLTLRALQERFGYFCWCQSKSMWNDSNLDNWICLWTWAVASIILLYLIWLSLIVPCDR